MSYKDIAKAAKKDGTTKKLDTEYVKFEKAGQNILGCLVSSNVVTGKKDQGSYSQYVFDTDDGAIKCAFGAAFDKQSAPLLHNGGIYSITYKGKEDIGKGRAVNRFEILEYGFDASVIDEEAKE